MLTRFAFDHIRHNAILLAILKAMLKSCQQIETNLLPENFYDVQIVLLHKIKDTEITTSTLSVYSVTVFTRYLPAASNICKYRQPHNVNIVNRYIIISHPKPITQ